MAEIATSIDFESALRPLWLQAAAGDELAYRDALACIAAHLRRHLRRRMHAVPDELEDLVQECLLAIHLHRGSFDPSLPVSSWVHAIARYKLVDFLRRRGRREALHDSIDDIDEASLPASSGGSEGVLRDVERLLGSLPEAQRRAIMLTKMEGLSIAEASGQTGVSSAAIKVQVHRGLKRMAALIRESP
jgi:RNA polymerase sigma-70 factor (ECF subfamily)